MSHITVYALFHCASPYLEDSFSIFFASPVCVIACSITQSGPAKHVQSIIVNDEHDILSTKEQDVLRVFLQHLNVFLVLFIILFEAYIYIQLI